MSDSFALLNTILIHDEATEIPRYIDFIKPKHETEDNIPQSSEAVYSRFDALRRKKE